MSSILVECQRFLPVYGKGAKTGTLISLSVFTEPAATYTRVCDAWPPCDVRPTATFPAAEHGLVQLPFRWWEEADLAWWLLIFQYITLRYTCRRSPNSVTWLNVEQRPLSEHWPPMPTGLNSIQEALLPQRDRAMRYVSRNLVNCSTTVRRVVQVGGKNEATDSWSYFCQFLTDLKNGLLC